jgi:hypothetical protein
MNLGGRLPGAAFAFASVAQARYRWLSDRRTHPPASSDPETTDLTGVEQARNSRFGSQASEPIAAVGLEYSWSADPIPRQLSSEVARLPSIFGAGAHQQCRSRVRGADATLAS